MNSAFTLTLLLSLLIATVYCNHEHNHHNNHGDDKWITFVSQIESFWKTETPGKSSETHTESTLNNKDGYYSEKTTAENHILTSEITLLNGTTFDDDDVKDGVRMTLAAIISIPIVGVIILICCCYCICKCCCGMCTDREEGHVIVMNSNVQQPPAQPTQIIVQQPIYQQVSPPQQVVHQYPPPPHMQYGQQQFQQQGQQQFQQQGQQQFQQQMPPPQYYEYPKGGIENPNFYHASAPPHSPEKY